VLIGEPQRTQYDLNFSIAGIPVRVHPLFWLMTVVLGWSDPSPTTLLTWIAVVFVSILIHELGHAIAMRYYGWQPSIVLYGMGGLATYNPGFTSSMASYRRAGNTTLAQIIISAAGPAAGFLLAGVIIAGLMASRHSVHVLGVQFGTGPPIPEWSGNEPNPAFVLVSDLLIVNIVWGIINLFPVYPLDGGQIAREILVANNPSDGVRQSLVLSILAGAGLAIFGLARWGSVFMALLFGYLAYSSYVALQGYIGPGGFGGGFRGRPW
jgi:Zn-dependent protease